MRAEQIGDLITRLGPVLDPLGITAFPEAGTWGIAINDALSVLVDLAEDRGKVVLSCELGTPPAGTGAPSTS
ncbi:hypothetical protein GCM10007886_00890 [Methylobacterium gregans]|uniref:Uncharacterized protein n=1 Tax=Methylobacterium gregans TaxID=374424 RepID=A0AA37HNG3_9HYPH|nr:type III secretion system chaperone [Methylobacterium gregans]MDQ0522056.1 hypothetical protein [Methylobacterium gregans]GJD78656.1 hypothetical protein NBEOAGPD_1874 [Methylobacterium gregans]GLS51907.1 hypothetical protein GCM10007886_00890 [Methylobacterium gregans]